MRSSTKPRIPGRASKCLKKNALGNRQASLSRSAANFDQGELILFTFWLPSRHQNQSLPIRVLLLKEDMAEHLRLSDQNATTAVTGALDPPVVWVTERVIGICYQCNFSRLAMKKHAVARLDLLTRLIFEWHFWILVDLFLNSLKKCTAASPGTNSMADASKPRETGAVFWTPAVQRPSEYAT